ncbi:MAG: hypothetical protein HY078_14800 [Elusimicrobia bacterium]|nr:hypothetical protein [Elusimicrobiota bacterium]
MSRSPGALLARVTLDDGEVWSEARRTARGFVIDWKRAARLRMARDGSGARLLPRRGAPKISVRVLRGIARALAGSLRGRESLHATGLVAPGGRAAVALLGESGAGKSTLAACLLRRGWRLLADDALPIEVRGKGVIARSGSGCLKLTATSHRGAGRLPAVFDPNFEKWILRRPAAAPRGVPLRAVVRLRRSRGGGVRFAVCGGSEAALLLHASFYNQILRSSAVLRRQFDLAAAAATRVPIWTMRYPDGFASLRRAAEGLECRLGA